MNQYEVSTLKKGLMILDTLQQEGAMGLSEIMRKFSLNKTTTFRLLYTLELMGYVKKVENIYSVTNKIGGSINPFNARLNWISVPPLYQLSSEIGESVYVGILHDTEVVTTQVVDGKHSMRLHSEVGESSPVHLNAHGKVIMAFLNEAERESLFNQLKLVQQTEHSFVDSHLLYEHLKVIRSQGYAIDNEEKEIGLRCIAAPILFDGKVIASVAISGPSVRLTKNLDRSVSKKLIQCSKEISKMFNT